MSTPGASPARRSSRVRKKANSYYDDAAKAVSLETQKQFDRRKLEDEDLQSETEDESDASMMIDSESGSDDDSDDERGAKSKKTKTTKKKSTPKANKRSRKSPASSAKKAATKKSVQKKKSPKGSPAIVKRGRNKKEGPLPLTGAAITSKKSTNGATVTVKAAFTKTKISQALTMLSKRVLIAPKNSKNVDNVTDDELNSVEKREQETPETSLVAALLASAKPIRNIPSTDRPKTYFYSQQQGDIGVGTGKESCHDPISSERTKRTSSIINVCLPQLDGIIRHLIQTTENDEPHEMHVKLLNLLFRSVGGSVETNIHSGTDLDELEDDDWDDLISKVVTVMKNESDADQTLLCADDDDGLDFDNYEVNGIGFGSSENCTATATATLTTRQIGKIAYRTIYKEFWYRLGHALLAHTPSPAIAMVSEEDSENHGDENNNAEGEDSDVSDDSSTVLDEDSLFSSKNKKRKLKTSSSSKKSKVSMKRKKNNNGAVSKMTAQERERKGFSSNRFQLEKVRDLILRMTELVSVGQPDLRAAGTLAVLQLAKACVERTVELEQKIRVASRQLKVAVKAGSKRKQQTLKHHLDNWKRHQAELQEMVEGPVFQGVFIHRYRDNNGCIRKDCIQSLSTISLIRPDIFLVDTYLKYFGWMASDKSASVRIAALDGLAAPFRVVTAGSTDSLPSLSLLPSNSLSATSTGVTFPIDISIMQNVTNKFLSRIVDCVDDSNSLRVQEVAMKLLLSMVHEEFLDEWDDDFGWEKINMKSFDPFASPSVRRDALYFVMDQIEAFDADGNGKGSIGDKKQLDQLLAIAKWSAMRLCDSTIPVDDMNIELVDHVVQSIVGMPEHRDLVLNWPMMLKAIRSDNPQQGSADEKEEIAAQRILLRILATSAEIEFGKTLQKCDDLTSNNKNPTKASRKRKKLSSNPVSETSFDDLSIALLKNLPILLDAFKSDTMSLRDVTKLPLTIASTVFGLPSHKTDFQKLVKELCQLYIDSTDEQILQNIAQTLAKWVGGDHTRISEVKVNMKRLSGGLQDRLMELFRQSDPENEEKRERKTQKQRRYNKSDTSSIGESSSLFYTTQEADTEYSISLLMLRWKIILMECKAEHLFEKAGEDDDEDEIEGLFFTISEAMGKRLTDRMPNHDREIKEDTSTVATNATIWKTKDPDIHESVSHTIDRALSVLLVIILQQVPETFENQKDFESSTKIGNDNMDIDIQHDFPVLKMRDNFVRVLGLCFDQHLPEIEGLKYSSEQLEFATSVQDAAAKATSDLRTLFPSDWSNTTNPVRKKLALTGGQDFETLISGFVRWFQSREDTLVKVDDTNPNLTVRDRLLPLARIISVNFQDFHRKEAGMLLKHICDGNLAQQTIISLTRQLKKTNPLRMLEAFMSCLKFSFENWVDNEPNEPEESAPSEEEVVKFEEAELRHQQLFSSMESVANKLSSTLGVAGRLSNEVLKKSICGFIREGIRFAFDGPNLGEDDELVVGSRLAFLFMLQKFTNWVKKEKDHVDTLTNFLISKELELRRHPEFDDVHPDDLNALAEFKKSLGIKGDISFSVSAAGDTEGRNISMAESPVSSNISSRRRVSTAGSRISRLSGLSELSPLLEEDDANDGSLSRSGDDDNEADLTPKRSLDDKSHSFVDDEETAFTSKRSTEDDRSVTCGDDEETNYTSKRSLGDDESLTRGGDEETTYASKRSLEDDGSVTRASADDETNYTSKQYLEDNESRSRGGDEATNNSSKRSSGDDESLTRGGDEETTYASKRSSEDDESGARSDHKSAYSGNSKRSSEDDGSVTRASADDETNYTSKQYLEDNESQSRGGDEATNNSSKRSSGDDESLTRGGDEETYASKRSWEDDGSLARSDTKSSYTRASADDEN